MNTNIGQDFDFDCACEEAKREFQSTVNCLLEIKTELSSRRSRAKDGAFFRNAELEVYEDWIMDTVNALMQHYGAIDRTNRLLNKRFKVSMVASKIKAA